MRSGLAAVAVVVGALLCACGGGGSSEPSSPSVTVALTGPTNVTAELFEGGTMRNVTLLGSASGDVASLNGKTIYVVVVDPEGLFEAIPPVVSVFPGGEVHVDLTGRVQVVPRHVTGNLTVNVCLDAACRQQLGGSPLRVPYDVTVLAGMSVDTTPLSVAYRFGDARIVRTFAVTLPKYLTGWGATALDLGGSPSFYAVATTSETGTDGLVTVTFVPTIPAVYTGKIRISTSVDSPSAGGSTYQKEILFTYTITDNPAVLAFYSPPQVSMSIAHGTVNSSYPEVNLVRGFNVTDVGFQVVEYLTWPAAANGHPNVNTWMLFLGSSAPTIGTCFYNNGIAAPPDCLPLGTYTARVHAVVTKGAQMTDVYLPVTLTVTP